MYRYSYDFCVTASDSIILAAMNLPLSMKLREGLREGKCFSEHYAGQGLALRRVTRCTIGEGIRDERHAGEAARQGAGSPTGPGGIWHDKGLAQIMSGISARERERERVYLTRWWGDIETSATQCGALGA